MRHIAMLVLGGIIGGVIGDISREWWRSGRRRDAIRLDLIVVAVSAAFLLSACASPPLDVRPQIARVN